MQDLEFGSLGKNHSKFTLYLDNSKLQINSVTKSKRGVYVFNAKEWDYNNVELLSAYIVKVSIFVTLFEESSSTFLRDLIEQDMYNFGLDWDELDDTDVLNEHNFFQYQYCNALLKNKV